jgi:hypothetical protein
MTYNHEVTRARLRRGSATWPFFHTADSHTCSYAVTEHNTAILAPELLVLGTSGRLYYNVYNFPTGKKMYPFFRNPNFISSMRIGH